MNYESDQPVAAYFLNKALLKLENYGMDVFEMYANEIDLSFCDRNRVIAKLRFLGRNDLKEIQCPDKLKQARWLWYTKKLRYSDKHASRLISIIDNSYIAQFVPKTLEAQQLARGIG